MLHTTNTPAPAATEASPASDPCVPPALAAGVHTFRSIGEVAQEIVSASAPQPRSPLPYRRPNQTGPVLDAIGEPVSFSEPRNAEFIAHVLLMLPGLTEALQGVTDHLAAVMGGPMIASRVVFENGVEGIPTIAFARLQLAKLGK